MYAAGFATENSRRIVLENADTGVTLDAGATEMPSGIWTLVRYRVPKSWRGHLVRLRATFDDTKADWMGFSEPVVVDETNSGAAVFKLFVRTLTYFVLLSIPLALAASIALHKGFDSVPVVLLLGLAAVGLAGYLAFWFWFFSPKLGIVCSVGFPVVCAAFLWRSAARLSAAGRADLLAVLRPWLLTSIAALITFASGFMYGGQEQPLAISQARYLHMLPMDNTLPFILSEHMARGLPARPFFGDWLTSDRPPLQTGFALLLYPFVVTPRDVRYEVTAVLLQCLWVPALWALLKILQAPSRLIYPLLAVAFFSECVLLNSFYVWPKLIAAAFSIGGSALLVAAPLVVARLRGFSALAAGAMLALGILAHGGSVFALPGLAAALWLKTFRPTVRTLGLAMAACILFYLPWTAYQRFYDPPGDRLLKMHLAGVEKPNRDSFTHDLRKAYAPLTGKQILDARFANLIMVFDHQVAFWSYLGRFVWELPHDLVSEPKWGAGAAYGLRELQFYSLFPTLGFMMFGPLFLVAGFRLKYRTPIWRAALFCWIYVLAAILFWCAVLFEVNAAVLHQGTYVIVLLGMSGSMLAFWNVSRRLVFVLAVVQSVLGILISVVYARGAALPGALAEGIFHPAALSLLLPAALLIAFYARTSTPRRRTPDEELAALSLGHGPGM